MRGALLVQQSNAAWFLILLTTLQVMSSQGSRQPVHVKVHSSTPRGEQQQELSILGSRPPSCAHKCAGCAPCAAIQVRTAATERPGPQSSNYEPIGWKCGCGSGFFDP